MTPKILFPLVAMILALPIQAQVINYEFTDNAVGNSLAGTPYSSTVSALAYSGNTWNVGFNQSGSDLLDSTGASTTVGFSLAGGPFTTNNGSSPLKLVQESYGSTGGMTLTLTGLNPTATYDLYLYNGFNGYGTNFSVGGVTKSTTGSTASSFTAGANYVEFAALNPTGTSLVATITNGSNGFDLIQGFQLDASSAPEPSAAGMLLAGAAGMLFLVRRRLA